MLRFLVGLGEAMVDSSAPVTQISESLHRVADVNGRGSAELIVLSTALMVSVDDGGTARTAVASAGRRPLRLEQVDAVFGVVAEAETGDLHPAPGLARLSEVRAMPPAFGPLAQVLGYVVMTVGLALVLQAGWTDLAVAALLGAGVGVVATYAGRHDTAYQALVPVLCAFGVALTVFLLARTGLDVGVFAPLIAPLVTFLPGALLTTSVIELSTGQMISGAGRLAAGVMQLVLLALGIIAAAQLVGVPAESVLDVAARPLGPWAPWIGVALFGIGVVVYRCARPAALGWIVLVLYVAYAGQVIGGVFFGSTLSGFFGALLMTPVAMLVATRPSGPYPFVSFPARLLAAGSRGAGPRRSHADPRREPQRRGRLAGDHRGDHGRYRAGCAPRPVDRRSRGRRRSSAPGPASRLTGAIARHAATVEPPEQPAERQGPSMSRSPVRVVVTIGLISVAVGAVAYAVSRAMAAQQHANAVADDIEAQIAALDPVTRAAVVARLGTDAANKVKGSG